MSHCMQTIKYQNHNNLDLEKQDHLDSCHYINLKYKCLNGFYNIIQIFVLQRVIQQRIYRKPSSWIELTPV